ncbi:cytochrome b5 reductase 4 isoform X1 [Bufo gargarizans]|uniref:cytochrome b5 reductase 4 isoform X1 n=1 Tax=Bufo gargarizans TaxID=30331 RepID=UPI001CF5FBED|nr:cytochrome b5 reductase 4 isoform X1 [Bufo gargarizans]
MLNVPSPSFPVPNSQQRVSAGGRNKTPLKPGRSLMDWIKLKSSGKDLTGLRGRLIEVTEEELAKHNKKTDCWTCIRGLVYNVTPYMEYHPGGEEELMKAAGIDGTQLFDQVHRWVNYESMLKECLIGRMAVKHASLLKGLTATENPEKTLINGLLPSSAKQEAGKAFKPRYDWFQTDSTVTLVIYTKKKSMFSEMVTVDYQDNILREEITIEDYSYLLHIELSHTVEDFEVCTSSITGKIEVILQKEDHKAWNNLGKSLEGDNSFIKKSQREVYYRKCRLTSKTAINHNTRLFTFELPRCCYRQVPVGHHVYLKLPIEGMEIVKPYTPVSQDLVIDHIQSTDSEKKYIYLMIKIYTNGSFTPHFDKLEIGDHVSVSSPQGCFRMAQIEGIEDIFLVAAGTGFTPMVKLLKNVLSGSPSLRKVKLIFFNKTEADILWREQLETLRLSDGRFEAQFILSEPSESWVGHKGQISSSLLSEALTRSKEGSSAWICICGPNGFVDQGLRCLEDLGFTQEQLFVFRE